MLTKCFMGTLLLIPTANLCRAHHYHYAFCITGETKARAFLEAGGDHPAGKRWG